MSALPGHRCSGLSVRVERLLVQATAEESDRAAGERSDHGEGLLALTVLAASAPTATGVWEQWGASLHCLVEDLVHLIS